MVINAYLIKTLCNNLSLPRPLTLAVEATCVIVAMNITIVALKIECSDAFIIGVRA